MNRVLEGAHIRHSYLDDVFLLSGSTNFISIQEKLYEIFGANKINRGTNSDTTVAIGAAAHAYTLYLVMSTIFGLGNCSY